MVGVNRGDDIAPASEAYRRDRGRSAACQGGGGAGPESGPMRNSAIAACGAAEGVSGPGRARRHRSRRRNGHDLFPAGPNGAGKTTTVNVLTTLIKADGGTARVAGHDVATETKAVRAAIGVTGQFAAVDELLTGQENLQLMADLKRLGSGEASPSARRAPVRGRGRPAVRATGHRARRLGRRRPCEPRKVPGSRSAPADFLTIATPWPRRLARAGPAPRESAGACHSPDGRTRGPRTVNAARPIAKTTVAAIQPPRSVAGRAAQVSGSE